MLTSASQQNVLLTFIFSALTSWEDIDSSRELQLLKRPRPLPRFKDEEKCIYAQWNIKVSIGYIESSNDVIDIRGCDYKVLLFGVDNVETIRDWLRFLVIRQRVPHSLVGKQFEWQVRPVKNDRQLKISRFSPLNCFRFV